MCNPLDKIVETITEKITDMVIQSVVRHVCFITRYKDNMKNLEAEKKNLEDKMVKIEEKVDQADSRGEEIEKEVLDWEKKAQEMKNEVVNFMNDKGDKENMQCFKFRCPNIISRYRLSKHVQKKIDDVKGHIQKGNFDKVSHPKPAPPELQPISSGDYVGYNSRQSVFMSIVDALKDSKVKTIGVYGTGGIGKTKMVEEVGKQMTKDGLFDAVMKTVVSQDANVSKIQGQLADSLDLKLDKETEKGRAGQLWNRLNNGKKNLVILDDNWQEMDLNAISIPITGGNKGCKVVLTSRNRDVWKNMQVDRDFLIQVLSESEAWDLFKRKVENSFESSELRSVAELVCKECQGLPVAILAVGAALKGKHEYAWESALEQLKNSMIKNIPGIDPKVYASLKLSYERLEPIDAKSCFLLCCLFPEDAQISIDVLVRHCVARRLHDLNLDTLENARRRVLTLVDTLETCCLLLDGTVVKMHDVIRDVAISIATDEKAFLVKHGVQEWPDKYQWESSSAISLRSKNIQQLPDDLRCQKLHTLLLQCIHPSDWLTVSDSFFSGMENLTVLDLEKARMLCQQLPSTLVNLVKLRMLCLNRCQLADTAILMNLNCNLGILSLQSSDIKELPPELAQLTRLRVLDLRYCYSLTVISPGIISNLSRLEELYIPCSFDQWEATTADELKSLIRLTTLHIHIPNIMLLPKDFRFEHLIWFRISVGQRFYYDDLSSSTRILKLRDIPVKDEFNTLLERAEELFLYGLEGLKKVLHDRDGEGFFHLKCLEVED